MSLGVAITIFALVSRHTTEAELSEDPDNGLPSLHVVCPLAMATELCEGGVFVVEGGNSQGGHLTACDMEWHISLVSGVHHVSTGPTCKQLKD